jgi:energy-coupling factor transporter ATP-binding protein EcfA2
MPISPRWNGWLFVVLATATAFLLLPLPRLAILFALFGTLYLPLKILLLTATALSGAVAGTLFVYGDRLGAAPVPQTPRAVADALTVGWVPKGDWIRLTDRALQHHVLLLGSSGSGKTQFLLSLLAQQIQRGGGCLMIDAKVDSEALASIRRLCRAADRLEDLRILWPPNPKASHRWNPLIRGKLQEVLTRVMALWGTTTRGEADFWRGQASTALHAVLGAMRKINPRVTFNDLYIALTSSDALLWLERTVEPSSEEHSALLAFLANYRNQRGQLDIERMKRMVGGAPSYVAPYAWGELGAIMNDVEPTLDLLSALQNGQIVYVALPILAETQSAIALARMLISDLKQAVGSLLQCRDRLHLPYLVLMDEASSYMTIEGIEQLFEQSRSAGVALVAAAQVASGFAAVNEAQQDSIFGNTATKIIMKLGDFASAELMAKTIGEELALFPSRTQAQSQGRSASWVNPMPDRSTTGQSETHGYQQRYDYTIRPEQFMHQRTGEAGVYIQDPRHGATLHADATLVYLDLPTALTEPLPEAPPKTNAAGLNLLKTLPKGAVLPPQEGGGNGGPRKRLRRRRPPAESGGVQHHETDQFSVAEPAPEDLDGVQAETS